MMLKTSYTKITSCSMVHWAIETETESEEPVLSLCSQLLNILGNESNVKRAHTHDSRQRQAHRNKNSLTLI